MDFNQQLWDSLRAKGFTIGDFYVQEGIGPQDGRMYVVIDGISMSFAAARALDRGVVTLSDIAVGAQRQDSSR
jgi:hypothetical protein